MTIDAVAFLFGKQGARPRKKQEHGRTKNKQKHRWHFLCVFHTQYIILYAQYLCYYGAV